MPAIHSHLSKRHESTESSEVYKIVLIAVPLTVLVVSMVVVWLIWKRKCKDIQASNPEKKSLRARRRSDGNKQEVRLDMKAIDDEVPLSIVSPSQALSVNDLAPVSSEKLHKEKEMSEELLEDENQTKESEVGGSEESN
jgi:hypothetical protein